MGKVALIRTRKVWRDVLAAVNSARQPTQGAQDATEPDNHAMYDHRKWR